MFCHSITPSKCSKTRRTTMVQLRPSLTLWGPVQSRYTQVADKLLGQTLFKLPHDRRTTCVTHVVCPLTSIISSMRIYVTYAL